MTPQLDWWEKKKATNCAMCCIPTLPAGYILWEFDCECATGAFRVMMDDAMSHPYQLFLAGTI